MKVRTAIKTNLLLRVGRRQADGYHPLETVFQSLDWGDDLRLSPAPPGPPRLVVRGREVVPAGEDNLVARAAHLLYGRATADGRRVAGVRILLTKRVPAGAGLGGGSGDAAATLLALDRYWRLASSPRRLRAVARRLGADVPFFLEGGTVRGTGRGDRMRALAPLPPMHAVIAVPPFRLATRDVYAWFDGFSLTSRLRRNRMRPALKGLRRLEPGGALQNDLEGPVFQRHPELADIKRRLLESGALMAGLSGSGSAVFALFASSPPRTLLAERRKGGWSIHRCRTLGHDDYVARFRSPLGEGGPD